jgi:hypothetical protein
MKSITFPIDSENRQATYIKKNNVWKGSESYTLQPNSINFIEVDEDLAAALEKILLREDKQICCVGTSYTEKKSNGETFQAVEVFWNDNLITVEDQSNVVINGVNASLKA